MRILPNQLSQGTVVDAPAMEQNIAVLESAVAEANPRTTARRGQPSRMVWGHSPSRTLTPVPWLRERNDIDGSSLEPPTQVLNPYRHPGAGQPGLTPSATTNLWSLDLTIEFPRPVTITRLHAFLESSGIYLQDGLYGATPPNGKSPGDPLNDMTVQLISQAQHNPQVAADAVSVLGSFNKTFSATSLYRTPPPASTMLPSHPEGFPTGWIHEFEGNVHVPAGRYRASVTVPRYTPGITSGWGARPHDKQAWSITLEYLEH